MLSRHLLTSFGLNFVPKNSRHTFQSSVGMCIKWATLLVGKEFYPPKAVGHNIQFLLLGRPPDGCLQYAAGLTGRIETFNWANNGETHLPDQE